MFHYQRTTHLETTIAGRYHLLFPAGNAHLCSLTARLETREAKVGEKLIELKADPLL